MARPLAALAVLTLAAAACAGDATAPRAPAKAARMDVFAGNLQTGVPGNELPQPIAVRVVDSAGAPVPNQVVNFRSVTGGGSMYAGTSTTDANGMAQDYWTLGLDQTDGPLQRLEVRAVDPTTGQKKVFAAFTAYALGRPTVFVSAPRGVDSVDVNVVGTPLVGQAATARYVWDAGDGSGAYRINGTTAAGNNRIQYRAPISGTSGQYWFCYYVLLASGARSGWACAYFGAPFS